MLSLIGVNAGGMSRKMHSRKLKYHGKFSYLLSAITLLLLSACDSDSRDVVDLDDVIVDSEIQKPYSNHGQENVLNFGFDLRASPQEDARQYLPFLAYLEKTTGYQFKLHFTSKKENIIDSLGKNHIQFAAIGAESFIRAEQKYNVIPLVRGLNSENKAEYQSVFVVATKSKIKSLNNISNKHLAFGSRDSTQGHLIPRIVLSQNKLALESFASYTYTGSHQNCANTVISAKADVCAMQDTMAKNMAKQGLLRIIHTSSYYPSSGIAASRDVPEEVRQKVLKALLNFKPQGKDKPGLYNWNYTEMPLGFIAAKNQDYKGLKEWSVKLGFLKEKKAQ